MENVTIPDSVEKIGVCAFLRCFLLKSCTIPEGVTQIEFNAFYECTSLVTVTIPDRVKTIGPSAFRGCTSLVTVTIPDTVKLGHNVVNSCSSFKELVVKETKNEPNRDLLNNVQFSQIIRILAPDHVINQLGGPFIDYDTLAKVPPHMRVVPDATTYASGALYLWWSDPSLVKWLTLSPSRKQMVWTLMLISLRLFNNTGVEKIRYELCSFIMTYVKDT